jgi:MFS family permease
MAVSPDAQILKTGRTRDEMLESINSRNFRKLMPLLVVVYVIAFIDRTNIGMAKAALETDIGLSAAAYGLGAGLFFAFYAILEIPSNLAMYKFGARFWITRIMITWGIIAMAMAFVWNDYSFYAIRVLLGAAEAGLYPGIIYYISFWFPRKTRAKAIGIFLLGVSVANIIGAPIGGLLLQMHGFLGIAGWQWMFILEGIPAVLLALLVWKRLPDRPNDAAWLTSEEKALLDDQLKSEDDGASSEHSSLKSLLVVIKDPMIWLIVVIYFTHQIAVYSLSYFLPSMISQFNPEMGSLAVGLITAIPWIAAAIGSLIVPKFAVTLLKQKLIVFSGFSCVAVGLAIAAKSPVLTVAVVGFSLAAFWFFVIQSVLFTFPTARFSGAAAAAAVALVNTIGLLGGFTGPTVMGRLEEATGNALAGLWFIVGLACVGGLLCWGLNNRSHNPDSVSTAEEE